MKPGCYAGRKPARFGRRGDQITDQITRDIRGGSEAVPAKSKRPWISPIATTGTSVS